MAASLVIGASRGLGKALTEQLSTAGLPGSGKPHKVYATVRLPLSEDVAFPDNVEVIEGVDLSSERCAKAVVDGLEGAKIDFVWIVAGLLVPENFDKLEWDGQVDMYKICAIAPIFIVQALVKAQAITAGAKVVYFTSESGSLALRTLDEGGGMYGHHGSKAASNMAGRLISLDLHPLSIPVLIIHPGFMRTAMTSNAFGESAWDQGGAIAPEEALPKILTFVEESTMKHSGQFWAPNGPKDVGQAENVMGKNLPTPLQLPW